MRRLEAWARRLKLDAVDAISGAYRKALGEKRPPVLEFSDDEFEAAAEEHRRALATWEAGLAAVLGRAQPMIPAGDAPDFEARRSLVGLWQSILDYEVALDRVKTMYEHFPAVSPARRLRRHAVAFALSFGAYAAQFAAGLRLIELCEGRRAVETLLDEPSPDDGIPGGRYAALKWNVLHVVDVARMAAGELYLGMLRPVVRRWDADLVERVEAALARVKATLRARAVPYFAANGLAILRAKAFRAWFPVQKRMAMWMGEVKLKHREHPLVSPQHVRVLRGMLEPGDLLVERRNWGLSNVGLPGFWPHAALYVGTPDELRDFAPGSADRLRERHPDRWRRYLDRHKDGHPHAVIEALSAGVILNSLETSAGADYVGVLRPRLPRAERAVAVERAFHYLGRPYDYDFDFTTDSALVCSELVYKCYQPGPGFQGIPFELVPMAGRRVLPPNEMVRRYDARPGGDLAFVAFLDGREKRKYAAWGGEKEFCASHRRPKWELLLE